MWHHDGALGPQEADDAFGAFHIGHLMLLVYLDSPLHTLATSTIFP